MRSVDEHLARVLDPVRPLNPIDMGLTDARGCILAEDVRAPWPLPPFDNSAMDGYAVMAAQIASASRAAPVRLKVVEDIPAGTRAS
jgi:molybdopterin molybdotransferase